MLRLKKIVIFYIIHLNEIFISIYDVDILKEILENEIIPCDSSSKHTLEIEVFK